MRKQTDGVLYMVKILQSDQVNVGTRRFINPFGTGNFHKGYYLSHTEVSINRDEAVIFSVTFKKLQAYTRNIEDRKSVV